MCIDFIRHGNGYDVENVTVTVTVTVPAGIAADDLDTVVADLWSAGGTPKELSSTPLTLTTRSGAVGRCSP